MKRTNRAIALLLTGAIVLSIVTACGAVADDAPADASRAGDRYVAVTAESISLGIHEIRGAYPGPTVALVAGVHGGKRSASRALERLRTELAPADLRGTVLLLPVANVAAAAGPFAQLSPLDSLNLNRVFPGKADGRPTERLAHAIMLEIVARSDFLVDLHGSDGEEMVGRFAYAARPGLRPAIDSAALRLATHWGTERVVWDTEGPRTIETSRFLQTAAHLSGVPAITVFEAGEAREDTAAIAAFMRGARRVLSGLGVLMEETGDTFAPAVHARRDVSVAPAAGHWSPRVGPSGAVRAGDVLGEFIMSGESGAQVRQQVRATVSGVVLHVRRDGELAANATLVILAESPRD